jgi:putative transcriptional regulator
MTDERTALVEARTAKNMSQEDLAQAVGCSQQYVSMIEAGTRTPGLPMAKQIASVVGVPVDRLFPDIVEALRALLNNETLSSVDPVS